MGESNILVKFRRAVSDPARIPHYLMSNFKMNQQYVQERNFGKLIGGLTGGLTGWNVYIALLKRILPENKILKRIHTNKMLLDLSDPGISRDLIMYNTREHYSTQVFRKELREMQESIDDDVTILELGANVGYYALQEADILGESADIHAFEPSPDNFDKLQTNIHLNKYGDRITTQNMAVGSEATDVELQIANQSNLHKVVSEASEKTVTIPGTTVEDYLDNNNIESTDVNVIRMDVQGFEAEIYKRMRTVVRDSEDLLMFIEIHGGIEKDDMKRMVDDFNKYDIEIVSAKTADGVQTWYEYDSKVSRFEDLFDIPHSVELIMRKS